MDYSEAPYWAISGIGYGKGFTAYEAVKNYVAIQMRNHPAKTTVFKTKAKWQEALEPGGECAPHVYKAPQGYTGFYSGMGTFWTSDDPALPDREFAAEDRVQEVEA